MRYRSFANALLLLLTYVLLHSAWEKRALASCGDWLVHPGPSHAKADGAGMDAQMVPDGGSSAEGRLTSNKRPIPLPCDGPFCRSVPTKPLPAAPPSAVNPSDKLLLVARDILCDPLSRWSFMRSAAAAHALRGFPVDIEHPPRA